jgi:phage-related protein
MVKRINWVGSSLKDLKALPNVIQKRFGYSLHMVESGYRPANAKTLSGFGNAKVNEIRENDRSGTYRAVYTVEIQNRVFVLHVFQKKSTRERETTRQDMKTIKERLREVENFLLLKEEE